MALLLGACQEAGAAGADAPSGSFSQSSPAAPSIPVTKPTETPTPEPKPSPDAATPTQSPTTTLTPSPTVKACLDDGGRVENHTLRTDLSPWPWEFRVYTPPCYDEDRDAHYPLLILIHGSTYNDDQWDRLGADETADELIAAGDAPPFLILMPRDRRWVDPPEDPFGEAVADRILPWVDENYRTIPAREYRAVGGLSRGAAWAVHLGLSRWEQFGAIGGHSLPVFWSDTPKIRRWLGEIPPEALPRIYLDIGDRDYLIESAVWFEGVLNEMNIPHEWHQFAGRHEEAYWMRHLEEYIRWYTDPW